jgi:cobalt/nickel transport system permease protein
MVVLLIYRYFGVMAQEADRITTAYKLRAPSQKGIRYTAWGTLVGGWLLRSMDRAGAVYESMLLRGFRGEYYYPKRKLTAADFLWPLGWTLIIAALVIWRRIGYA